MYLADEAEMWLIFLYSSGESHRCQSAVNLSVFVRHTQRLAASYKAHVDQ